MKMGLISEPNSVYPILNTLHLFCYSIAHFSTSLLVCVRELVACGYFVWELATWLDNWLDKKLIIG